MLLPWKIIVRYRERSEKLLLDIENDCITYIFYANRLHSGIDIFYPTGALFGEIPYNVLPFAIARRCYR